MHGPDPNTLHPLPHHRRLVFLKNLITRPNIEVGEYTYYDDFEDPANFERNVLYHFDFIGDRLIIGKFCALASGVKFIMNGGNHETAPVSTYPFAIFGGGWEQLMAGQTIQEKYPSKGDTVVGHDVWIGHEATIMPGVHIGNGAIVATMAVVTRHVPPYAIVAGNPAEVVRFRFDEPTIARLQQLAWWHWPAEKITRHLALLNATDVAALEQAE
ncbi:CatB-related O-acetyltransferase [Hymenobacter lutimineralis]|uniref:CatB-related O-acetyltransferase n=1 Tax=Hymenobacter lutimineralis TaxID=2606448 RepID=A0A5D6VEH5_9BACT|nr:MULTISPECIES: CatB-related O-acetyltransferase [Hymenobacter]QIX60105.1 CatB-related O-acetyltransferase [Hymenobacter sp. BT18]TYZ14461.1 CatB-related O-acetyltransferase [Hymenobacter lutimineralis]